MHRKTALPANHYVSKKLVRAFQQIPEIDVVSDLLKKGADPNSRDAVQRTPLFPAVRDDRSDIVRLLIAHKADVNAVDVSGLTPLIAYLDTVEFDCKPGMIRLLVDNGARVSLKTYPFPYSLPYWPEPDPSDNLMNAMMFLRFQGATWTDGEMKEYKGIARALLHAEDALADLNTCAKLAAEAGDLKMLIKAFQAGADISGLLPHSISYRNYDVAKFLMDNHAVADSTCEDGVTALYSAATGNARWVRKLLAYGANPDVLVHGQTALDAANASNALASATILIGQKAGIFYPGESK